MSRYAEASWVPAGTPGGAITPRVLILHTEATVGQAQPHSGLEWHFMVMNDGHVKQLVDTNRRADANNLANAFAISVETEDDGTPDADKWTPQQVKAIVKLCRWAHEEHGIPLRRCNAWNGSGIGYHTMWGAPSEWTPVSKTCPGAARKAQFESEILPLLTEETPDMDAAQDARLKRVDFLLSSVVPLIQALVPDVPKPVNLGTGQVDPAGKPAALLWRWGRALAVDLGEPVDIDEKALAAELAPLLTASVPSLSDADLAAIAEAVADEHARRAAA